MFRMHAALVLCTALMAPFTACAGDKTIVIGQAIDLSGPNGSIGRDYVAGITTYFDSLNVKGGINGKKIEYIVRDDRGEPAESARLASELIRADRSDYLLGAIGSEATRAILAAPAFAESRHVLFAPMCDSSASARARHVLAAEYRERIQIHPVVLRQARYQGHRPGGPGHARHAQRLPVRDGGNRPPRPAPVRRGQTDGQPG
jgi:ABC-type branched-subunit amino acid transport system substrate-binding protein